MIGDRNVTMSTKIMQSLSGPHLMAGRSIFTTVELSHKRIKWWQRCTALVARIKRDVTAPPLIDPAA